MSEPTASATRPKNSRKSHHLPVTAPPAAISAPADLPLRERVAARLQGLAAGAQCADLAEGAGDPEIAGDTVRQLMAHQLAAGHTLAMGLTARAGRLVRECEAQADGDADGGRRSMELLRFVGGTARLMERCRAAAVALDRIGHLEPPEDPDGDGPHHSDHPQHYAWRLSNERKRERRQVLDWLAQGKKAADLPDVEDWPPYHNPDPDIEKLDERIARTPRHAAPDLRRGRLRNGNPSGDYLKASRCGARTRCGGSCRQPAMTNGRCRFHGGKSTGPRTVEGRRRSRSARLVHGFRSADIIDLRSAAARIGRDLKTLTAVAHTSPPASIQRYNKNTPLPLRERACPGLDPGGQGVRGLTRGIALMKQTLAPSSPAASKVSSRLRSDRAAERLLARLRAKTPHPCPSPSRGEGIPSSHEISTRRAAGHGVDRSNRGPVVTRSRRRLFG